MKAPTIRSLRAAEKRMLRGIYRKHVVADAGRPFVAATRFRGLVRDLATICETTAPALVGNCLMRSEINPTLVQAEALQDYLRRFLAALDDVETRGAWW